MKLVSWNVNGLRACIQKGFLEQFNNLDADFFCLQETKLSEGQLQLELPGYEQYWCYAEKKGYSGTAIFTKHTPRSVHYGLDVPELDNEGRLITLEYDEFYLVTCYTPNAQRGLARLEHRMKWDEAFRVYLQKLDEKKPVILCGDLNVAHQEIDLKNPKSNRGNAGFSDEERESFQKTLDLGFTDSFRHLHPDATGCYSWWSYMFHARENNAGWRIDYFLVSDRIQSDVYRAEIHSDILGSDHCPVSVEIDLMCNGGMWSPTSLGAAKALSPDGELLDKPRASAEKAKALAPIAAILALVLVVTLLWQPIGSLFSGGDPNGTTLSSEYFQIHIYTVAPKTGDHPSISSVQTPCLYDDTTMYYIDDPDSLSMDDTNTWLRIELTEKGRALPSDDWDLMLYSMDALVSSSMSTTVRYAVTIPYYLDADHDHLGGWFYFTELDSPETFSLHLQNGVLNCSEFIDLIPRIDLTTLQTPLNITVLTAAPNEVYDDLQTAVPERWADRVSMSIGGYTRYAEAVSEDQNTQNGCYWIYVEPSRELMEYVAMADMDLTTVGLYFATTDDIYYKETASDLSHTRSIYGDKELTEQVGWLIYGSDPSLGMLELTLQCYYMEESVRLDPVSVQIPDLTPEDAFTVTAFSWPPTITASVYEDTHAINLGEAIFYCRGDVPMTEESLYWLYVEPTEDLLQFFDYDAMTLSTFQLGSAHSDTQTPDLDDAEPPNIYAVFSDPGCSAPSGWLICGNDETLRQLEITLIWDLNVAYAKQSEIVNIAPYITADVAAAMTTNELVHEIMQNKAITDAIVNSLSATDKLITRLIELYPLMAELANRDDAVQELMCYPVYPESEYRFVLLTILDSSVFREKMSLEEEVRFYIYEFPGDTTGIDWNINADEDISQWDTEKLVIYIANNSSIWSTLSLKDTEFRQQVYQILRESSNVLQELEKRDDALEQLTAWLDYLEEYIEDDPACALPYLIELWPYIESLQPENQSTEQLLQAIKDSDSLCRDIIFVPTGVDEGQYYADLFQQDPLLYEFCRREDAVRALMDVTIEDDDGYRFIYFKLLTTDIMLEKMTAAEQALFIVGDFNSKPMDMTFYDYVSDDISSWTTEALVEHLGQQYLFYGAMLDTCSDDVKAAVYQYTYDHSNTVPELITRSDALAALQAYPTEDSAYSNLIDLLIELWPTIEAPDPVE